MKNENKNKLANLVECKLEMLKSIVKNAIISVVDECLVFVMLILQISAIRMNVRTVTEAVPISVWTSPLVSFAVARTT